MRERVRQAWDGLVTIGGALLWLTGLCRKVNDDPEDEED